MKTSNLEMNPLHEQSPDDAIGMLIADHKRVANLFAEFKRLTDEGKDAEKASIVEKICQELTIHAQIEEELFYPAVRNMIDDDSQMDEALVEHAGAKQLIAQLQGADPDDDLYDAKVTVLGEQIDHHVEEEEGSMFPKARHAGVDTQQLGEAMLALKAELRDEQPANGFAPHADETHPAVSKPPGPATRASAKRKGAKSKSAVTKETKAAKARRA